MLAIRPAHPRVDALALAASLALACTVTAATIQVPNDYGTIQAGVDAAAPGDEVVIAPGTYTGPGNRDIQFMGKAITVRSEDPEDPQIVATRTWRSSTPIC